MPNFCFWPFGDFDEGQLLLMLKDRTLGIDRHELTKPHDGEPRWNAGLAGGSLFPNLRGERITK
ncbi:hypothetical protein SAMN05444679_13914 [Variovorax sp. CF079]|uniref:hypothetical protein n=1 Tax=Variovorax sp. CF079 TaxID=1882774 RepID=UPI0008831FC7|nr:hypothetical protein [Variovorax sp. CF079]SDE92188.1 hypothetical protein SAMN05444679_13914 [Variovorax sp. CF079]